MLGHVNNAATWAPIEDECTRRGVVPARAELEFPAAIAPDDEVILRSLLTEGTLSLWLVVDGAVRASASVVAAQAGGAVRGRNTASRQ